MSISPVEFLRHILDETEFLTNRFGGVSKEDFLTDETLKRAAVRRHSPSDALPVNPRERLRTLLEGAVSELVAESTGT